MSYKTALLVIVLLCIAPMPLIGNTESSPVESPKTQTITSADLKNLFSQALMSEYHQLRGDFEVHLLRPQADLIVPEGSIELTLSSPPSGGLRSRILLRYDIKIAGEKVYSGMTPIEVKVMQEVLVSNRRLNRKETLSSEDLELAMRDVLSLSESPIDPTADLSGYHVYYSVMKGTILTERHLRLTPVVNRGDIVTGWLKRGLLQINLKLEVMEEAAPGQLVRVRNIKTRKTLRGIVRDEDSIIFP